MGKRGGRWQWFAALVFFIFDRASLSGSSIGYFYGFVMPAQAGIQVVDCFGSCAYAETTVFEFIAVP